MYYLLRAQSIICLMADLEFSKSNNIVKIEEATKICVILYVYKIRNKNINI